MANISRVRARLDTWVDSAADEQGHGSPRRLVVGANRKAFIFFVRPFPLGATVTDATLRLRLRQNATGTLTVQRVSEHWIETGPGKVTWNRQPDVAGVTPSGSTAGNAGDYIEIDVTSIFTAVSSGSVYHGLCLTSGGSDSIYHSAEAEDPFSRPELVIEWSITKDVPMGLAPRGGAALPISEPLLRWIFPGQTAYQVLVGPEKEVDEEGRLLKVSHDTGIVHSPDTEARLSYRVPEGEKRFWQVKITSDDGTETGWTRPEVFVYRKQPKLEILEPKDVVNTPSPRIRIKSEGKQTIVQYILRDESSAIVWDSGRHGTDATSFAVPIGVIRKEGTYELIARVWDDVRRASTPGYRSFSEQRKTFKYEAKRTRTASPSGEAEVTANEKQHGVTARWTHEGDADAFLVKANGIVVEWVDAEDARRSDGSFEHRITRLPPNREYDVEIEPVVRGVSAGTPMGLGPIVDVVQNVHLTHPTIGAVVIIGQNAVRAEIGEDGATFAVPGRRDPVRLMSTVRGYEGQVSGGLYDYNGVTGPTYRNRMEDIKWDMNASPLTLSWRDMTITVAIEECAINPTRAGWYTVEFGFFQIDDYTFGV